MAVRALSPKYAHSSEAEMICFDMNSKKKKKKETTAAVCKTFFKYKK